MAFCNHLNTIAVLAAGAALLTGCRFETPVGVIGEERALTNTLISAADLPAGVLMKYGQSEFKGASLYGFYQGKLLLCGMYLGNEPTYPLWLSNAPCEVAMMGNARYVIAREGDDNACSKEVFYDLSERVDNPRYVHVWYDQLPLSNMVVAEQVFSALHSNIMTRVP